jgi:hypothetical protein
MVGLGAWAPYGRRGRPARSRVGVRLRDARTEGTRTAVAVSSHGPRSASPRCAGPDAGYGRPLFVPRRGEQ